jgi:hypothetical protein
MTISGNNNKHRHWATLAYSAGGMCFALAIAFSLVGGVALAAPLAATAPGLGAAASFSVLAALSASAAGAGTTISGDLGLSPGLASSRTGPWTVGGTEYFGPLSLAANAQIDALGAFVNLAGQPSSGTWSGATSPAPGVWTDAGSSTFAGTLMLTGSPTDVWVFQIGTDLTFSGSVSLGGGARACNVFWQIGRDATIGVGSAFVGTLIASRDVTVVSGASVDGRIISLTGALTTDGNSIFGPSCAAPPPSGTAIPLPSYVSVEYVCATDGSVVVTVGMSAGVIVYGLGAPITSAVDTGDNKIVRTLPAGHYAWQAVPPAGHYMVDTASGVVDSTVCGLATVGAPSATATSGGPSATATIGGPSATVTSGAPVATATSGGPSATATIGAPVATVVSPILIPNTGADLAERQLPMSLGFGFLSLGLVLLGFALRRKRSGA